jgi:hypothetical protein
MEFMLRWWDELDDTLAAYRRLLADALEEFGSPLTPLAGAALSLLFAALYRD